jgi:CBS-domain-containing membrane protein
MSVDKEREYSELLSFVSVFATHVWNVDAADPVHPANVAEHIAATRGKAQALVGARQAANDAIESLQSFTQQRLAVLDARLHQAGSVTLAEMCRRYSWQYKTVLRRGSIRNDTEFYLVKGILDSCTESLSQDEQAALSSLLLAFEQSS